jgi:hypothetical protein
LRAQKIIGHPFSGSNLKQRSDELRLSLCVTCCQSFNLTFPYHVHGFDAFERPFRFRPKGAFTSGRWRRRSRSRPFVLGNNFRNPATIISGWVSTERLMKSSECSRCQATGFDRRCAPRV